MDNNIDDWYTGKCQGCSQIKQIHEVGDLGLCEQCEEEFYEGLVRCHEDQESGEDFHRNEKSKKED